MKSKRIALFSDKSVRNILILFVIPSLILSISLIFTYTLTYINNKNKTEQNCLSSLKLYSQVCEAEISSAINSASSLYYSQTLMDYLQNQLDIEVSGNQYSVMQTLSSFKNSNKILDDIFIIDKTSEKVIDSEGLYSMDSFFNDVYVYKNFGYDYWNNFSFFDRSQHRILSPSKVKNSDTESTIIPIVFRSFSGIKFSKLFVINISLDALFKSNAALYMTDNTDIFILNRYTGDVFGKNDLYNIDNIIDTSLYNKLLNTSNSFNFTLNEKKLLIVSHTFSDNLLGYTYFATVPYSDIHHMQSNLLIYSAIIYIAFLFIALYISIMNAKKVITPIKNIATTLDSVRNDNINIFESINSSIIYLKEKNDAASKTLSFAQEKYLIDILNSTDLYIDNATCEILKTSLPFTKNYFISVIFQIFPKREFFDHFSLAEYDKIFYELHNIIKTMFTERLNAFFLSSERETFYIILNTDESFSPDKVSTLLDEIYVFMRYDNNYLNIYTGVSGLHKGLNGLKEAHREATASIKSIPFDIPKIIFHDVQNIPYFISSSDESKLYNSLISLDIETVKEMVRSFTQNISEPQILKYLYMQILNIFFRVMHLKNMTTHEQFDEYISIMSKSPDEIYHYILNCFSYFEAYKLNSDINQGGQEIIEYMKNHFNNPSLSLDYLADLFNVNPNYLSQVIKKNLGIGFHEFLSNLRISHSRELLAETDMNIQDIYEASGFSSKQTFFRIFKNTVGMTPNEYRKNN